MKPSTLPFAAAAALLCAASSLSAPAPAEARPDSPAPAPHERPRRRALPPEAFTVPTNFVYLVNVGGAVDADWLSAQAATMQRSLQVGVKAVAAPAFASPGEVRSSALRFLGDTPEAKLVIFLADGEGFPPVLASPYEAWALMDAGWVKRGRAATPELESERMGKRLWQTIGALCGAAYRPEREAVMRYCPTPQSLDDCLSHNFHPMNANAFSVVARAIGLDPVRLRPRQDLVELGILKPRPPKAAPEVAPDAAAAPKEAVSAQ